MEPQKDENSPEERMIADFKSTLEDIGLATRNFGDESALHMLITNLHTLLEGIGSSSKIDKPYVYEGFFKALRNTLAPIPLNNKPQERHWPLMQPLKTFFRELLQSKTKKEQLFQDICPLMFDAIEQYLELKDHAMAYRICYDYATNPEIKQGAKSELTRSVLAYCEKTPAAPSSDSQNSALPA